MILKMEECVLKKFITKVLINSGTRLCALSVVMASITPMCCRGSWYQPEEPDGLEEFLGKSKNIMDRGKNK